MMKLRYIFIYFFLFVLSILPANLPQKNYVEGEVLVRFKPSVAEKIEQHRAVISHNLSLKRKFSSVPNLYHFKIPAGVDIQEVIKSLSSDPDVLYAEPNYIYKSLVEPNDPYYGNQWALPKINAPSAWDKTTGSSSVVIAVIDTGIDYTHSDLSDNIWTDSQYQPGYNAIKNSGDPMDGDGHGTHCAGIIGARGNNGIGVCGVNWNVKIMALKFLDDSGNGTLSDAIKCIDYVIARKNEGENIVATSNSWGGYTYSTSLYDAILKLSEKGILFVAAAGNSGTDNDTYPMYPASYNLPNIISVASSDSSDSRSFFSNYGRTKVHIAAPGSSIYSTLPVSKGEYGYKSGTSMATPFVAGVAGLISSLTEETDALKLKKWILQGITRLPQWTNLTTTGGRLNVTESLRVALLPDNILPVENFTAERNTEGVILQWDFPVGATYVIIRRSVDTFSSRWDEGDLIYTGTGRSFMDKNVTEGITYYYTIWAYYGSTQQIEEDKISAASYTYTNSPPYKPECILPEDGAVDVSLTPLLKATGFVDPDNDKHNASQWQIARDGSFNSIVWDSISAPVTEIAVPSRKLFYSTQYYWRVRYQDEKGLWSEWANPSSFTTEAAPSGGGGGGGGGCFIATAVFGSPFERHVQVFREFRDKRLLTNRPGRTFVRWYYKHSPEYANIIRRRPFLKLAVRMVLVPLSIIIRLFI